MKKGIKYNVKVPLYIGNYKNSTTQYAIISLIYMCNIMP